MTLSGKTPELLPVVTPVLVAPPSPLTTVDPVQPVSTPAGVLKVVATRLVPAA